jgi:hypothetical protein
MRCEDAVIAVAVHARRWHEGDEALEELQSAKRGCAGIREPKAVSEA